MEIHYRRPPDRVQLFRQTLVHETDALVTWAHRAGAGPVQVGAVTVLEAESPVVWFTFPGAWHDIGRFHTPAGHFTGFYANVLTPVRVRGDRWETTDLFLDVFLDPAGQVTLLDADELDQAEARGWVDGTTAARARAEADRLMAGARDGSWPPQVVLEWTLDRARAAAR